MKLRGLTLDRKERDHAFGLGAVQVSNAMFRTTEVGKSRTKGMSEERAFTVIGDFRIIGELLVHVHVHDAKSNQTDPWVYDVHVGSTPPPNLILSLHVPPRALLFHNISSTTPKSTMHK
ncbi:hypothetical protein VNO77_25287 [Canavalia gladiata]|uniref:Uncharacterized protein n=1 Tax=Canavalia gladiata TaxID=3824 RepID=A0AAN9L7V0_CANGL